jgi:hypothetical protein
MLMLGFDVVFALPARCFVHKKAGKSGLLFYRLGWVRLL